MEDTDEHTIFQRSRTDKTYVGPSFPTYNGRRHRIANKYIDGGEGYEYATVKDELVLRTTAGGRFQIKATFIEDDRSFQTVTIQKFSGSGRAREYFSFFPAEVATLLKFLSTSSASISPTRGRSTRGASAQSFADEAALVDAVRPETRRGPRRSRMSAARS